MPYVLLRGRPTKGMLVRGRSRTSEGRPGGRSLHGNTHDDATKIGSEGSRADRHRIMPTKRCQKVDVLKNLRGIVFCTVWQAQPPQDDDTADLLAPVPAARTGGLVGYAHVSTKGQLLDRQIHALTGGCIRIFAAKKSGKNADARNYGRPSTTCARVTPSLSRRWTGSAVPSRISSRSCPVCASVASVSPRCMRRSTRPRPADAWSSTCSRPWRSPSASSSCRAPTRAWTLLVPAVPDSAARRR